MLPGGGVEPGETPEQALVRELAEETGYDVVVERLLESGSDHRTLLDGTDYHADFTVHEVTVVGGELRHESGGSSDQVAWVPVADVAHVPLLGIFEDLVARWVTGPRD